MSDQIMIIIISNRIKQLSVLILMSKHSTLKSIEDLRELRRERRVIVRMPDLVDFVNICSKDEDIRRTYLLMYFDIGSIHSAYDETSIDDKLHIGGTTCFHSSS